MPAPRLPSGQSDRAAAPLEEAGKVTRKTDSSPGRSVDALFRDAAERADAFNPRRGVIFQDPNLFPWPTVWENMMFGPEGRWRGRSGCGSWRVTGHRIP